MLGELLSEPAFKTMIPIVVNYDTDGEFKTTWKTPDRSTILVFRDGKEAGRLNWETGKDAIRALLAGKPAS